MTQDKDPFRRIHPSEGATETAEPGMIDSTRSASAWDAMVERLGGSLVQSWGWGELHRRHGFRVERILIDGSTGPVMAQILIRRRGPVSVAYLPRGPLFMDPSPAAEQRLFAAAAAACQRHRTLVLTIEPPAPLPWANRETGFEPGERRWHHSRTVKIPLLDDDALLAQMRSEARRKIRQAPRRGVVVEQSAVHPESLATFYALLRETATRNRFTVPKLAFFADFMRIFDDDAALLFAYVEGVIASALIVVRFGQEAVYWAGASSTAHRGGNATTYLHFEAMRWARNRGCSRYDLWGISAQDPKPVEDGDKHRSVGDDWSGLYHFKTNFGGEIVAYPPTLERRYHRFLTRVARRLS